MSTRSALYSSPRFRRFRSARSTPSGTWERRRRVLSAALLLYLAIDDERAGGGFVARFVALEYVAWSGVVIAIALSINRRRGLLRLPQWTLLLPVAALAWGGTL